MKRRDFFKNSLALGTGSFLLSQLPFQSFANADMLPLINCPDINDRVLVLVFMKGGNDGLNTIIPTDQYDTYSGYRPTLGLSLTGNNPLIALDSTLSVADHVHLHPTMTDFKSMYDAGKASIIQGVGYPLTNGSHFKSTDLWLSGGDGTPLNNSHTNGWIGRYLSTTYPGLYANPIPEFQDPLGIQLGDRQPSLGYHNHNDAYVAANLSKQNPEGLYDQVQGIGTPAHSVLSGSKYDQKIAHIMNVENSTNIYAERITNVFNTGTNSSTTYPSTNLANQLKTVAKLISGGCKTKVYMVHLGGFDTHFLQAESGNPHLGVHASLLADFFSSTKAFHDDLANMGLEQRVMTASFSEFGRQTIENGSFGTDHGTLGPMFLFGSSVEPGMIGTNLDLTEISSEGKPLETEMQFDYRQVFRTLMQDWLGASSSITQSTLFDNYPLIPSLVATNMTVDPSCYVDAYISQIHLKIKVFLEGFCESNTTRMHKKLNEKGLLPLSQPYNTAPFNYSGTELVDNMRWNTVDWVLLELRDANDMNIIVTRQAAFVNVDGEIRGMNGEVGLTFKNVDAGSYYVVVYHRNHIAIVSSTAVDSTSNTIYDFTMDATSAYGTNQLKDMETGIYAMYAGDMDANGLNNNQDYDTWRGNNAEIDQYLNTDVDGDGIVNNKDRNLWKRNKNQTGDLIIQQ